MILLHALAWVPQIVSLSRLYANKGSATSKSFPSLVRRKAARSINWPIGIALAALPVLASGNLEHVPDGQSAQTITFGSIANQTLSGNTVVAWGDSLTVGNQDGTGVTYPKVLQSPYGQVVLNEGAGGNTSTQILTRFQALPGFWGDISLIWSGRNNVNSPSTIESDIATMVSDIPPGTPFLVLSITNGEYLGEGSGGATYNQITSLNAALAASYPNNYLDIRSLLVAQYNPANPDDVIDHANDVVPYSFRAQFYATTLATAITSADTCSIALTAAPSYGQILTVDNEQIYVAGTSGASVTACVRGYASTTPTTHLANASVTGVDPIHLNSSAYTYVAQQVYAWLQAHVPPVPSQTITLNATASSGLTVSYTSSTPAVCTVSGNAANLVATGTCNITASQPGDQDYAPATPVTQSFTVAPHWSLQPPSLVSITPNSGSGATQTFTAVYSDVNGADDLSTVGVLINSSLSSSHACYLAYSLQTNALNLGSDDGSGYLGSVTLGSTATLSNSQCTVSGVGSSYSINGNTATLQLALAFSSSFTGSPLNIYMLAIEADGVSAGWLKEGSWAASGSTGTNAGDLQIYSGNNQAGATTRTLQQPFIVNSTGYSAGETVTFKIVQNSVSGAGGTFTPIPGFTSAISSSGTQAVVTTDGNGYATSPQLTTNGYPGSFTVTATDATGSVTFAVSSSQCLSNPVVTLNTDSLTADSVAGSLRQAVDYACTGSTITFQSGLASPITLVNRLRIDDNLTISGPDASSLAINGGGNTRLFFINAGNVSITGLTLQNGLAKGGNGGGGAPGMGGAIFQNGGNLTLAGVNFSGNKAQGGSSVSGVGGGGFGGDAAAGGSGASGGDLFGSGGLTGSNAGGPGGPGAGGGLGSNTGGQGGFGGGGGGGISQSGGAGGFGAGGGGSPEGGLAGGFGGSSGTAGSSGGGGAGFGGAVFQYAGTLSLSNDIFTGNTAAGAGGGQGKGGAVRGSGDAERRFGRYSNLQRGLLGSQWRGRFNFA